MQAGTTPNKRTSISGRNALKLKRLDGARRSDQAASDAHQGEFVHCTCTAAGQLGRKRHRMPIVTRPRWQVVVLSHRRWAELLVSGQPWPLQGPFSLGQAIAAASRDPPVPGDSPHPAPPVPPQQPTKIVDTTPRPASTVPIPALTSKPPQATAPPPPLPEPPPLPAKPTKPSKWWMLLMIIPAIATGLAVVASETLFKNFRRRRTNWQARLLGRLDLMGDNITQWSRRASRPIQIDPTSPSSERPSTRPWYKQRRNTPITPACSNRPSGSLTSPKSLRRVVN